MKRGAQIVAVLVLLALIGYIVWNDWLGRTAAPPGPPPPPVAEAWVEEEIVGIGAVLKGDDDTGLVRIVNALPNSPAMKAGLTSGLLIQKINDTTTEGLPLNQCVNLIRGAAGTKLRLQVWNPESNETNRVELTRARVALPPMPAQF